ncbi:MAG: hypothetical protein ABIK73_07835 [candidate division WOR-3 bacterium]
MEKIVFEIPQHLRKLGLRKCILYGCDRCAFFSSEWETEENGMTENKFTFANPSDWFYLKSQKRYLIQETSKTEEKSIKITKSKALEVWDNVRTIGRLTGELWLDQSYKNVGTTEYTSVFVRAEDDVFSYGPILTQYMGLQAISNGEFNSIMRLYEMDRYMCQSFRLAVKHSQIAYVDLATSNSSYHDFDDAPIRFDAPNNEKFIHATYYRKEAVFSFATPGFGYAVKNEDDTYKTGGVESTASECLRRLKWGRWDFSIDPGEIPKYELDFPYALYFKKIDNIKYIF